MIILAILQSLYHIVFLNFKNHYIIIASFQYWQRRSAVHSFSWNTYSYSATEELRPDYHGDSVIDPVTGLPSTYYPSWKRRGWYIFSFLAMLPLLLVGVAVMTLSLNLNGYVKDPHSPIFVAQLARFSKPVTYYVYSISSLKWLDHMVLMRQNFSPKQFVYTSKHHIYLFL